MKIEYFKQQNSMKMKGVWLWISHRCDPRGLLRKLNELTTTLRFNPQIISGLEYKFQKVEFYKVSRDSRPG